MMSRTPRLSAPSGFKPDCSPRAESSIETWRMILDSNQNNLSVDSVLAGPYVAVPSTIRKN
jgi:hypothetical protein